MAPDTTLVLDTSTTLETLDETNAVAVYSSHSDAEKAICTLAKAGIDLQKLSIVGRGCSTDGDVVAYYNADDRMRAWGKTGVLWSGLWGMLFGSALFVIPGLGPVFVAGPLVAWMVRALEGATVVGGMSVLGAGLLGIGIPSDRILTYETQIKTGKFVVIANGARDEVVKSQMILWRAA